MERYTISIGPVTSVMELEHTLRSIPNYSDLNIIAGDGNDFVLTVIPDENTVIINDKEEKFYAVGIVMDGIAALPLFKESGGDTMFDFNTIIPISEDDDPATHWGCPYNTNDTIITDRNTVTFLVAETIPLPVFIKLSQMYPAQDIQVSWVRADSKGDKNTMTVQTYLNGTITGTKIEEI